MKRIDWKALLITSIICMLPILLGVVYYQAVPEQVAIHFDAYNNPNSWMDKNIVLFVFPVVLGLVQAICCIVNDINKKKKEYKPKVEYIYKSILPVISIFVYSITLATALGAELDLRKMICFFLGIIFLLVGNYIPKTNNNYTHGIRPKSLVNNKRLWRKANRTMGFTFVILGILTMVSIVLPVNYSIYAVVLTITVLLLRLLFL